MGHAIYKIISDELDPKNTELVSKAIGYLEKDDGIYDKEEIIYEIFDSLSEPGLSLDRIDDEFYIRVDSPENEWKTSQKLSNFKNKFESFYGDNPEIMFSLTGGLFEHS